MRWRRKHFCAQDNWRRLTAHRTRRCDSLDAPTSSRPRSVAWRSCTPRPRCKRATPSRPRCCWSHLRPRTATQLFWTPLPMRWCAAASRTAHAQFGSVGGKQPNSLAILEFCGAFYIEANRETQYFEILIKLFDVYLKAGNVQKASDTLEKLLDIDPYDHRNQERLEKLRGRVDDSILKRLGARLSKSGTAGPPRSVQTQSSTADSVSTSGAVGGDARHMQALEDLIVQTEIFLQYSLQNKALERLQKIASTFPR